MDQLLLGMMAMACGVAGLFFLRFWRDTRDRLFAIFGLAFWVLGLTRLWLALVGGGSETSYTFLYLIRLVAFVLIIIAIADKNRFWRRKQ